MKEYPAKLRLTALQCFFSCMQSAFWTIAIERSPSAWKIGWDMHLLAVVYCVSHIYLLFEPENIPAYNIHLAITDEATFILPNANTYFCLFN